MQREIYLCIILADHGVKHLSCLLSSSDTLFTLTVMDGMVINVLIKDNKEKQLIISSILVRFVCVLTALVGSF